MIHKLGQIRFLYGFYQRLGICDIEFFLVREYQDFKLRENLDDFQDLILVRLIYQAGLQVEPDAVSEEKVKLTSADDESFGLILLDIGKIISKEVGHDLGQIELQIVPFLCIVLFTFVLLQPIKLGIYSNLFQKRERCW